MGAALSNEMKYAELTESHHEELSVLDGRKSYKSEAFAVTSILKEVRLNE
jgi:hypothetical protein